MNNADDIASRLRDLPGSDRHTRGAPPSEARQAIRASYDAIVEARSRNVPWSSIAKTLADAGVRTLNGRPITPDRLKSLWHAERDARDPKPKVRKRRPKPPAGPLARYVPPEPAAPPAPAGDPAAVAEARLARLDAKTLARSPDACTPAEAEARLARLTAKTNARSPR